MKLAELIEGLSIEPIQGSASAEITGIAEDSRRATAQCLFAARSGLQADGLRFVGDAVAAFAARRKHKGRQDQNEPKEGAPRDHAHSPGSRVHRPGGSEGISEGNLPFLTAVGSRGRSGQTGQLAQTLDKIDQYFQQVFHFFFRVVPPQGEPETAAGNLG